MLSPSPEFFQTKRSLSEIKAELLPAYFQVWAETAASEEFVLANLNAGNGLEENGEKAATLKIQEAEKATEKEAKKLKLFLGDASKTNLEKLKQSLYKATEEGEEDPRLPENTFLLTEPENREMLAETLKKVPGLVAADPFSYALAEEIIANVIQNSSADLFLLFDFKKLEKAFLAENANGFLTHLFGEELPESKTKYQLQKSPKLREQFLMEQLENAFRKTGFYPLTFKVNAAGKGGNTIYLLLANRSPESYFRAKEWLQTFSEKQEDGVPLFGVNLNYQPAAIPGFSDFLNKYSLENLTQELAKRKSDFHYKTIREVYEGHSHGTTYIYSELPFCLPATI